MVIKITTEEVYGLRWLHYIYGYPYTYVYLYIYIILLYFLYFVYYYLSLPKCAAVRSSSYSSSMDAQQCRFGAEVNTCSSEALLFFAIRRP